MVFSLGAFLLVIGRQDRVAKCCNIGRKEDGTAKMRRTSFGHFVFCTRKFAGLCDGWVYANKSNKFLRFGEP